MKIVNSGKTEEAGGEGGVEVERKGTERRDREKGQREREEGEGDRRRERRCVKIKSIAAALYM